MRNRIVMNVCSLFCLGVLSQLLLSRLVLFQICIAVVGVAVLMIVENPVHHLDKVKLIWVFIMVIVSFIAFYLGHCYCQMDQHALMGSRARLLSASSRGAQLAIVQIDGEIQPHNGSGLSFVARIDAIYDQNGKRSFAYPPIVAMEVSGIKKSKKSHSLTIEKYYTDSHLLACGDRFAAYVRFHAVPPGHYAMALLREKITVLATTSVYSIDKLSGFSFDEDLRAWQGRIMATAQSRVNEAYGSAGSIPYAMAVGDRTQLSHSLIAAFAALGIIHAIVASGATVRIIMNPIIAFMRLRIFSRFYLGYVLFVLLLALFLFLSNFSPPAVRAAIVLLYEVSAGVFHRHAHRLTGHAISAFVLALMEPHLLIDTGVILSYLAVTTFSLLPATMATLWLSFIPWRRVRNSLARGLSADLVLAPVAGYEFGTMSWITLLSNLILYPFLEMALPIAWFLVILAWVIPEIAHYLQPMLAFIATYGRIAIGFLSQVSTTTKWPGPTLFTLIFYEIGVFMIFVTATWYTKRFFNKYFNDTSQMECAEGGSHEYD